MADASLEDRLAAASSFILQSPPGEVNDVFNDVRPLIGDDSALRLGLMPALSQYNSEQFTVVDISGSNLPAIICPSARVPGQEDRFLHPASSQTFAFDQFTLTSSDVQSYTPPNSDSEKMRKALEEELTKYVEDRYEGGVSGVFTIGETSGKREDVEETANPAVGTEDDGGEIPETATEGDSRPAPPLSEAEASPSQHFRIHFVGNKYNPSNYWTGRWRSTYDVNFASGEVTGEICVHVHYYEQGNVQLSTKHNLRLAPPSGSPSTPAQVLKAIGQAEQEYQTKVNEAYGDLGDKAFRQLRRALPVTKQRMDWNKISAYRMGAELPGGSGAGGNH